MGLAPLVTTGCSSSSPVSRALELADTRLHAQSWAHRFTGPTAGLKSDEIFERDLGVEV